VNPSILNLRSLALLEGQFKEGDHVTGTLENGRIVFKITEPAIS